MPRGGARSGAGRKPGTPNRVTAELQAVFYKSTTGIEHIELHGWLLSRGRRPPLGHRYAAA